MDTREIVEINSEELKGIIASKREKDFSIIDVREKFEYEENHIPGALWIELSEIINRPELVPGSKEVVFYCKAGPRSMVASEIFGESEKSEASLIYNLKHGLDDWNGAKLETPPKIDLFKGMENFEDLIKRAMELEKGAFNFYGYIYDNYKSLPYLDSINVLRKAETAHAKTLFKALKKPSSEFDSYFESLKGDIIESGITAEQAIKKIENFNGNFSINLLEFLLLIEASAYDLYKVMAEKKKETKTTFLKIAQEEKAHMRSIASSFILCA